MLLFMAATSNTKTSNLVVPWNIVLLIIQLAIMGVQIWITIKAARTALKTERGIFMVCTKDRGSASFQRWTSFDFDDANRRYINFTLSNAITILKGVKVFINQELRSETSPDTIFTLEERNNKLSPVLNLTKGELEQNKFDCEVRFSLETLSRIKYVESIKMVFTKESNGAYWHLHGYNPQLFDNEKAY